MPQLTPPKGADVLEVPVLGCAVAPGETVNVKDKALAEQLVAQGWTVVKSKSKPAGQTPEKQE